MTHRRAEGFARCVLVFAIALVTATIARGDAAEPLVVGDTLEPFALEDQHGELRAVDASVAVILFSRDMKGGDLLKKGLEQVEPGYLDSKGALYVSDISGMPRLIARMFAIPSMRKRPYSMLLDRDGTATVRLPDEEGRATLIFLERLEIVRIVHVTEAAAVLEQLEGAPAGE